MGARAQYALHRLHRSHTITYVLHRLHLIDVRARAYGILHRFDESTCAQYVLHRLHLLQVVQRFDESNNRYECSYGCIRRSQVHFCSQPSYMKTYNMQSYRCSYIYAVITAFGSWMCHIFGNKPTNLNSLHLLLVISYGKFLLHRTVLHTSYLLQTGRQCQRPKILSG